MPTPLIAAAIVPATCVPWVDVVGFQAAHVPLQAEQRLARRIARGLQGGRIDRLERLVV